MNTVQIRDGKKAYRIPACELAPGMVRAMDGETGEVFFVDGSMIDILTAPQHPPFNKYLRAALEPIRKLFACYYPGAADHHTWELLFRMDEHPWREMAIWATLVEAFQELASDAT